jgi:hypothetical protein
MHNCSKEFTSKYSKPNMSKMPMEVSASSMLAPNLALMRDISQSNTLLYASLATESLAAFASSSVLKANVLAILVLVRFSAEKDHQFSPNCCVSKHRVLRALSTFKFLWCHAQQHGCSLERWLTRTSNLTWVGTFEFSIAQMQNASQHLHKHKIAHNMACFCLGRTSFI